MKNTQNLLADFNESTYLQLNPDVLEAVQRGGFSSGWEHYILHGLNENRPGKPNKISKKVKLLLENNTPLPSPPPNLRVRVHGDEDLANFNKIGKVVSLDIELAIQSAAIQLDDHCSIFDFGCGCGRVLRWFHRLYENSNFYGTDIDNEAISWCRENISHIGNFSCNELYPPLPFKNEFFDFVYCISIFTHLPEDMQFVWLEELQRITKKDSFLFLTVHGEELFPKSLRDIKKKFEENGFYYFIGDGTKGLPSFYQTSFHTEKYIRNQWSKFFEIKKIIRRGIANRQDLILCVRVK